MYICVQCKVCTFVYSVHQCGRNWFLLPQVTCLCQSGGQVDRTCVQHGYSYCTCDCSCFTPFHAFVTVSAPFCAFTAILVYIASYLLQLLFCLLILLLVWYYLLIQLLLTLFFSNYPASFSAPKMISLYLSSVRHLCLIFPPPSDGGV